MSSTPSALSGPGANTTPWRPPQWNGSGFEVPALTLTAKNPQTQQQTAYVFDGIIHGEHDQTAIITLNPVQTGAAITDDAYIVPPTLNVEIAMSDAMQSFTVGQFSSTPSSKSVSAYQTLITLQAALTPVQVATRLRQYSNMMITRIRAVEDEKTKYGLRAFITFTAIITAFVTQISSTATSSSGNSQIPQTTNQTSTGQTQTSPIPQSIQTQNNTGGP
jgi:hypothetical protein